MRRKQLPAPKARSVTPSRLWLRPGSSLNAASVNTCGSWRSHPKTQPPSNRPAASTSPSGQMPSAPRKACSCRGCPVCAGRCPELTAGGKCALCTSQSRKGQRRNDHIYSSPRWKGLRRTILREQPFCAEPGCSELTADVDHIVPIEVNPLLKWDRTNLQGLCKPHHSAKTARETLHKG